MPEFWWMRLDLVFLVGTSTSGGVFGGVCGLIMILGSLSANGWGCRFLNLGKIINFYCLIDRMFLSVYLLNSLFIWGFFKQRKTKVG